MAVIYKIVEIVRKIIHRMSVINRGQSEIYLAFFTWEKTLTLMVSNQKSFDI